MNASGRPIAIAMLSVAALLAIAWQVHAEATRVTFPEISKLTHYTTVRRGNVTEHIMTTPAAIDAVKDGQPIRRARISCWSIIARGKSTATS